MAQKSTLQQSILTKLKGSMQVSDSTIQTAVNNETTLSAVSNKQEFSIRALQKEWPDTERLQHEQIAFANNQVDNMGNFIIDIDPLNRLDNLKNCIQQIITENKHDFLFGQEDSDDKPIIKMEDLVTIEPPELQFIQQPPQNIISTQEVYQFIENENKFTVLKDGKNMSELELFTVAFDEVLQLINSKQLQKQSIPQIVATLSKIKNYFVNKATRRSTEYLANEQANKILNKQLIQTQKDLNQKQSENDALQKDFDKIKEDQDRVNKDMSRIQSLNYNLLSKKEQLSNQIAAHSMMIEQMQKRIVEAHESQQESLSRAKRLAGIVSKQQGQLLDSLEKLKVKDHRINDLEEERLLLKSKIDTREIEINNLKKLIIDNTSKFERELNSRQTDQIQSIDSQKIYSAVVDLRSLIDRFKDDKYVSQQIQNVNYLITQLTRAESAQQLLEFLRDDNMLSIRNCETQEQAVQVFIIDKRKRRNQTDYDQQNLSTIVPIDDRQYKERLFQDLLNEANENDEEVKVQEQTSLEQADKQIRSQVVIPKVKKQNNRNNNLDTVSNIEHDGKQIYSLQQALLVSSQKKDQHPQAQKVQIKHKNETETDEEYYEDEETDSNALAQRQHKDTNSPSQIQAQSNIKPNHITQAIVKQYELLKSQNQQIDTNTIGEITVQVEGKTSQICSKYLPDQTIQNGRFACCSIAPTIKSDFVDQLNINNQLMVPISEQQEFQIDDKLQRSIDLETQSLKPQQKQQINDFVQHALSRGVSQNVVLSSLHRDISVATTSEQVVTDYQQTIMNLEVQQIQNIAKNNPFNNIYQEAHFVFSNIQRMVKEKDRIQFLEQLLILCGDQNFINQILKLGHVVKGLSSETSEHITKQYQDSLLLSQTQQVISEFRNRYVKTGIPQVLTQHIQSQNDQEQEIVYKKFEIDDQLTEANANLNSNSNLIKNEVIPSQQRTQEEIIQAQKQAMLLSQSGNNQLLVQKVSQQFDEIQKLNNELKNSNQQVSDLTIQLDRIHHKYANIEKHQILKNYESENVFVSYDKLVQTDQFQQYEKLIQTDGTIDQFLASTEIARQMKEMGQWQFEDNQEQMQQAIDNLDNFKLETYNEKQASNEKQEISTKKQQVVSAIVQQTDTNFGTQFAKDTFQLGMATRVANNLQQQMQELNKQDDLELVMQKTRQDSYQPFPNSTTSQNAIKQKISAQSPMKELGGKFKRNQQIENAKQQFLQSNFRIGTKLNFVSEQLQKNLAKAQTKLPIFEQFENVITLGNQQHSIASVVHMSHIIQHPRYGEFSRKIIPVSEPLIECFQVLHPIDKNFLKFNPLEKGSYCPMVIGNYNLVKECSTASQLMILTHKYYNLRIQQIQTQQIQDRIPVKVQSLIPNISEQIKYLRCKSMNFNDYIAIPIIFELIEQLTSTKTIIREFNKQRYFEIPFNNIVVKSLKWLLRLIRQIVKDRINTTTSILITEGLQSQFITEMVKDTGGLFFNVVPGAIQRKEAESLAAFTYFWVGQKYGRANLANVLIYSLIANLVYWQFESDEVYLFSRMFFGDLGTDYQLLYFDLRKCLGYNETVVDQVQIEKVSLELTPDILRSLFKNWNGKRQQGFLQNLYAVVYSQQYEFQTEIPQVIDFTILANLCLYSFATYRRTFYQQTKLIFNYLAKELQTDTFINIQGFRQLCSIVLPQFSNQQVNEFWFMFGYGAEFNKKIMSTNHFQDFFESSGLGRFGAIHPNVIEKVTSLQLKQLMKNVLFIFESLKPTLISVIEHMHIHITVHGSNKLIKLEKQIVSLVDLIKCDIQAYDYPNVVGNMKQLVASICDMFLHLNPAGATVVLGGAFTACSNFIQMLK